jgi:hypothetical protein
MPTRRETLHEIAPDVDCTSERAQAMRVEAALLESGGGPQPVIDRLRWQAAEIDLVLIEEVDGE